MGHASITLGNAFIVFGGDTKIEESDTLDDNLYLLNTTSLKWTVAGPSGCKPSGRYGHTISTIGSVLYVFGGQLDDYFFDDLVCYDLTTLQSPSSNWNFVKPTTRSPPPRTNHTVITFDDKLYLFGGTDGKLWYSDTWVYDPADNTWSLLECAGFIPAPCEGHSATIVGDAMYVFGGRSAEGKDLGTLSALKIPAKKWFSFQNMGPGPTSRSGHSMTAFADNKILIMGGESPDMDQQSSDGTTTNETDSNNSVYILDTTRINYPTNANVQPEKRQIAPPNGVKPVGSVSSLTEVTGVSGAVSNPHNPVPAGTPAPLVIAGAAETAETAGVPVNSSEQRHIKVPSQDARRPSYSQEGLKPRTSEDLKNLRSESVLSELTPGYGYERVNVGGPNEKGDNSSLASETESVYSEEYHDNRATVDTPASGNPDSSPSDMSQPNGAESPFSVDTVRADSTTPVGHEKNRGIAEGSAENVQQVLERLKASNSWYESELAAARERGFIPDTRPPVDVLKLRRVSQRITMDTDQSLSERTILVEALSELKEELQEVQQNIQHQAEQASIKIAESEADRDEAFERMKLLEAQLMAAQNGGPSSMGISRSPAGAPGDDSAKYLETIASLKAQLETQNHTRAMFFGNSAANPEGYNPAVELDKVRSDNVNLEQQLRSFSDKNILAQHESSRYKNQLEDLSARYHTLEDSADLQVRSLEAASLALSAAQTKTSEYSNLLASRNNERGALLTEMNAMRSELEATKHELGDALQQLDEHKVLLARSTEQSATSTAALSAGISNITAMWADSKPFKRQIQKNRRQSKTRDMDLDGFGEIENEEEVDPEMAILRKELKEVTQLYEAHQQASSKAAGELSGTLQQVSFLKQELVSTESMRATTSDRLERALIDLQQARSDLDSHQTQLHENKRSLDTYAESAKQQSSETQDAVVSLRKQLEDNEERYISLENEYDSSLQYVQNSDKALTKTRDELSRFKDINTKLQSEIDQMRLRLQDQEENDDTSSVASSTGVRTSRTDHRVGTPPAKYNSRQIDLQLRDLRAQIIILQEERDELRASTLDVKKKLITNKEDLKDAQTMIEDLETENEELMKRLTNAEKIASKVVGAMGRMENDDDDDEDDEQNGLHGNRKLGSFKSELEQIRNEHELH